MDVVYFEYDGISSEDYGYCIASFDSGGSIEGITTDSQRNFNQVLISNGSAHPFTCSTYDDHLEMAFSIIKDPCQLGNDSEIVTVDEMRFLKRWLNRPSAHKLVILDEEYENIFWEGSFNLEEAVFSDSRIGVNATFFTNRPYGLFDEVTVEGNANSSTPLVISTGSDEIGSMYPTSIEIICNESGNLSVYNGLYPTKIFVVNNCSSGEVITIDKTLQISSSLTHATLANDCNYKFPMLYTRFNSDTNNIYSSISTTISIKFNPVAKVVIV